MTAKGNLTLGFIQRIILANPEAFKNMAYNQLVHPVLGYVSAALIQHSTQPSVGWKPNQRKAARFICGIRRTDRRTSTTGLLWKLDLKSLSERRGDGLKVFSQYHHLSRAAINNYVQRTGFSSARKHMWQCFIPHTNTLHYQQ